MAQGYRNTGMYIVSNSTGRKILTAQARGDYLGKRMKPSSYNNMLREFEAREKGYKADLPSAKRHWNNYNQWRYDAGQKRDKATAQIRRNYGSQNQKLRDILVGETNRKYKTDLRKIERGATKGQLDRFYQEYSKTGDPYTSQSSFIKSSLGKANVDKRGKDAGEERARQAAGGRAPRGGTSRDATNEKRIEDEAYYGW